MKYLSYRKIKCDLCYEAGYVPIIIKGEEDYNTLKDCPMCETKGELRILNTEKVL